MGLVEEEMLIRIARDRISRIADGNRQERAAARARSILYIGEAESLLVGDDLIEDGPCIDLMDRDSREVDRLLISVANREL